MQTLVFDTTAKEITLYDGVFSANAQVIFKSKNVPTVKISELGFYEVMVKTEEGTIPVYRAPIMNTNMLIRK